MSVLYNHIIQGDDTNIISDTPPTGLHVPDTNVGESISRQAAIELVKDVCVAIMSVCNSHYDSEVGDEVYDDILEVNAILTCNKEIRKALKGLPSVQPRKGKWIRTRTMTHDGELYCDQCEQEHPEQKIIWNFCPSCGCRMEEGE